MSGTVCEHEGLRVTLRREYKNGGVCERSECPCGYAVEFYDNSMAIPVAAPEAARYPCDKCGELRTKAEGGTVFTVCDACWDAPEKPEAARSQDPLGTMPEYWMCRCKPPREKMHRSQRACSECGAENPRAEAARSLSAEDVEKVRDVLVELLGSMTVSHDSYIGGLVCEALAILDKVKP